MKEFIHLSFLNLVAESRMNKRLFFFNFEHSKTKIASVASHSKLVMAKPIIQQCKWVAVSAKSVTVTIYLKNST
jgi:hypothetical protein